MLINFDLSIINSTAQGRLWASIVSWWFFLDPLLQGAFYDIPSFQNQIICCIFGAICSENQFRFFQSFMTILVCSCILLLLFSEKKKIWILINLWRPLQLNTKWFVGYKAPIPRRKKKNKQTKKKKKRGFKFF